MDTLRSLSAGRAGNALDALRAGRAGVALCAGRPGRPRRPGRADSPGVPRWTCGAGNSGVRAGRSGRPGYALIACRPGRSCVSLDALNALRALRSRGSGCALRAGRSGISRRPSWSGHRRSCARGTSSALRAGRSDYTDRLNDHQQLFIVGKVRCALTARACERDRNFYIAIRHHRGRGRNFPLLEICRIILRLKNNYVARLDERQEHIDVQTALLKMA